MVKIKREVVDGFGVLAMLLLVKLIEGYNWMSKKKKKKTGFQFSYLCPVMD
jgi:hypothetical protein